MDEPGNRRLHSDPREDPVRRFFRSGFTASDIAEPVISFDGERPVGEVRERMAALGLRLAGVRLDGLVRGSLRASVTGDRGDGIQPDGPRGARGGPRIAGTPGMDPPAGESAVTFPR